MGEERRRWSDAAVVPVPLRNHEHVVRDDVVARDCRQRQRVPVEARGGVDAQVVVDGHGDGDDGRDDPGADQTCAVS